MTFFRSVLSLLLCAVFLGVGFFAGLKAKENPGGLQAVITALIPEDLFRFGTSSFKSLVGAEEPPEAFSYYAPGNLVGRSGTGPNRKGSADWTLFAADMAFPVAPAQPAFLNSQIHSPGGGAWRGSGPNNQCVRANYSHPWRDNFCERRGGKDRESLNCPSRAIHQGVDIRGGTGGSRSSTCARMAWDRDAPQTLVPVVAAEDGWIEYSQLPHKYVVTLITDKGRTFNYMHLDRASLVHAPGARVAKGETIGYLSDYFGRSKTTQHLHFEILQNIDGKGWSHVSPYMSLVRAYERDHGVTGVLVQDEE